jgi:hypothetical protein
VAPLVLQGSVVAGRAGGAGMVVLMMEEEGVLERMDLQEKLLYSLSMVWVTT